MKIAEVATRVVSVPYKEPEAWRFGRVWGLTNVIVEVRTDEGLVGVGEAPGNPAVGVVRAAVESMGELITGLDPLAIGRISRMLQARGWHHYPYLGNQARGAIEIALWDILGKAVARPLHQLLGGEERTAVPFYWYVPAQSRDRVEAAEQAQEGVDRGFRTIYLKIGFDLANDISIVRAVREQVGDDIAIRVDANEAWSIGEAVGASAALEDLDLEFLEQPIDMHDIDGLALLRGRTKVPLGANQTAWLEEQVLEIVRKRAADVIVTDQHQLGGLIAFARVAGMCEIAKLPVIKHSFGDLGVTTAAALHQLAMLHEPAMAHQTHLAILEHDLLAEPFGFDEGALTVPTGPGLGIALDYDAVAHYEQLYDSIGEFSGYAPLDSPSPLTSIDGKKT